MDITVPENYQTLCGGNAENLKDISLTIKGRGNASWKLDKKPYKLKLESKTAVLGMPKHKHFALIAFPGYLSALHAVGGFEMARLTGQSWAPRAEPVEVVLNDEYLGRYFMVESIKIDKNRLNIFEQDELNENPETLTGGWLVEIDNYDDEFQISIPETEKIKLRVTHKSPEVVSDMQRNWLTEQFTAMNEAIYSGQKDGNNWAELIDAASVARYFIVREVLHDTDGYNGSFYLHKDLGDDCKWTFGPMWDMAAENKPGWVMHNHPAYSQVHWIEPLFATDAFVNALCEQWPHFYSNLDELENFYLRIGSLCKEADKANAERWPQYDSKADAVLRAHEAINLIKRNAAWVKAQVDGMSGINPAINAEGTIRISNNRLEINPAAGEVQVNIYTPQGICVESCRLTAGDVCDLGRYGKGLYIISATSDLMAAPTYLKTVVK